MIAVKCIETWSQRRAWWRVRLQRARPSSATCATSRLLSRALSMDPAQGLIEGKAAEGTPIICDVRDVACAHVAAAERPSASGRYIVSQRAPITPSFVSQTLMVCCPEALFIGFRRNSYIPCMLHSCSAYLFMQSRISQTVGRLEDSTRLQLSRLLPVGFFIRSGIISGSWSCQHWHMHSRQRPGRPLACVPGTC